jgi:prepilin signal peptidase PulO-like enzyme (type II secretory pathway)
VPVEHIGHAHRPARQALLEGSAFLLGSLFGALASGWLLVMGRKGRREYIPFGTGVCLAAIAVLIAR